MSNARRVAVVLFIIAGLVAFARVGMGARRGSGLNVYEVAMGVLAFAFAYYFAKLLPAP